MRVFCLCILKPELKTQHDYLVTKPLAHFWHLTTALLLGLTSTEFIHKKKIKYFCIHKSCNFKFQISPSQAEVKKSDIFETLHIHWIKNLGSNMVWHNSSKPTTSHAIYKWTIWSEFGLCCLTFWQVNEMELWEVETHAFEGTRTMYLMNSKMRCRPRSQAWKRMQTHMSSMLSSCVQLHSYSQQVDSFRFRQHLPGGYINDLWSWKGLWEYQHPNRIQSECSNPESLKMNKIMKTNRNNKMHRSRWVMTGIKTDPKSIADHRLDLSQQCWLKNCKHTDMYFRAQFVNFRVSFFLMRRQQ